MRVALKIVAGLVGAVVLLAGAGLGFLALKTPAQRPASAEKLEATPARLARGEYLVEHVSACVHCHSDHDEGIYGMPLVPGTKGRGGYAFGPNDGVPGFVQAQNITPDPETGKGNWTDGELLRAIREGISKDGHALFPMMPYENFRAMSDEDAKSVVVYLRTLAPVRHPIKPRELAFPVNFLVKNVPQPLTGPVAAPDDAKDHHAYGEYLVTIAGCAICHTPMGERGQRIEERRLGGGWEMKYSTGRVVTANITPAEGTWLSEATRDEFIGRFRAWNQTPPTACPKTRNTLMPWDNYAGMTDQDLTAIYDYLKTVKPVPGVINPWPDAEPALSVATSGIGR